MKCKVKLGKYVSNKLELLVFFAQCLVIPSGDFHCDGSEQMGCVLGLCCVKVKGLLYLLFFRGGYLCHGAGGSV